MANDVVLLIVVPLTLVLEIKDKAILVILETITANTASAFNFLKVISPFGLFFKFSINRRFSESKRKVFKSGEEQCKVK